MRHTTAEAPIGASAVVPGRTEAASNVRSCTGDDIRIRTTEKQMLVFHNSERASRDLPRLCVHPKLQRAANAHSDKMIRRNRFTHGNVGRHLMKKFDYQWSAYVENISRDAGRPSPEKTFNGSKTTSWTVDLTTRR